jgi:hypothetical protein
MNVFLLAMLAGLAPFSAIAKSADPAAIKICENFPNPNAKEACIQRLADLKFDPAAPTVCRLYPNPSAEEACMQKLGNLRFEPTVPIVCGLYPSPAAQETCMRKLGNLKFDPAVTKVCRNYVGPLAREECLFTLGDLAIEPRAAALCEEFNLPNTRRNCLQGFGDLKINYEKANSCIQMRNDPHLVDRLNCFREAAQFDVSDVKTCSEYEIISAKLQKRLAMKSSPDGEWLQPKLADAFHRLQQNWRQCSTTELQSGAAQPRSRR